MKTTLTVYGAARTVTGSRHLVTIGNRRILVDCGLFQGPRELRERNWHEFPVPPNSIDVVILTHAHTDHIGYLPRLIRDGFRGPVYCTKATKAIAQISLPDSARLQEEEARYHAKHRLTHAGHGLPLYNESDAYYALSRIEAHAYNAVISLGNHAEFRFLPAGHILGSAFADITLPNGETLLMSGDLGRFNTPLLVDPTMVATANYLVLESTYGDRLHPTEDPESFLEKVIHDISENGKVLLIPSFAIGRTQELLYYITRLQSTKRIKRIPIFIDSPMATATTLLYHSSFEDIDDETKVFFDQERSPIKPEGLTFVRDREGSKELNSRQGPFIVIAGSGMASGGRIVHHLRNRISRPDTTVLFAGYQAEGTLGRRIVSGESPVNILGASVEVKASIISMGSLSAHADQSEIMGWLSHFAAPPSQTFLVHGEYQPQLALQARIQSELGWNVNIPSFGESFELTRSKH